jgi:hypothetical protein
MALLAVEAEGQIRLQRTKKLPFSCVSRIDFNYATDINITHFNYGSYSIIKPFEIERLSLASVGISYEDRANCCWKRRNVVRGTK